MPGAAARAARLAGAGSRTWEAWLEPRRGAGIGRIGEGWRLMAIAGELAALAQQRASGALRVRGDPGGIIYLSQGCLAFAESAGVPDLGSRLVNSRRLLPGQWRRAELDSGPGACPDDLLVRRGLLDAAEWEVVLRSAALDALLVLAVQLAAGPPAGGTSFTPGPGRGTGLPAGRAAGPAWAYAKKEAGRLAGHAVVPQARPRLCGPGRAVAGNAAAAVLAQMDGRTTIRELAWRNGLALYAVMDWIAGLAGDGVCAIAEPPGPAGAQVPGQGQDWLLPRRPPGIQAPAGPGRWTPPDPGMLGRLLAALQKLE